MVVSYHEVFHNDLQVRMHAPHHGECIEDGDALEGCQNGCVFKGAPLPHPPCNDLVLVNLGFKNLPGHSGVLAQVELVHPCK